MSSTVANSYIRGERRTQYRPRSHRHILCVYPRHAPSFTNFHYAHHLVPGVRAFMSPQGLLLIAAYMPKEWEVKFIDENLHPVTKRDYRWADAVLITGMHVQRAEIEVVNTAAHSFGKLTVLGGPSVSSCPEYYTGVDILHLGEIGDATDAVIEHIDNTIERPREQLQFRTSERLPLDEFPIPAFEHIDLRRYFVTSAQFSSGCHHRCEFCDIPALYGGKTRTKTPEQVIAEMDEIVAAHSKGLVHFVDDNFVGNPKAASDLLGRLIEWQRARGYPLQFVCEATLNLAQRPDILQQMREAAFTAVFCGIESPEPQALQAMHKEHNLRQPILDAVRIINSYGIEVVAGIIFGFDTDTPETPDAVIRFIHESGIPMATANILYALPKTPLYERLQAAGRINEDLNRESNMVFRMPHEEVIAGWRRCITEIYSPKNLVDRFLHQARHTYPNRLVPPRRLQVMSMIWGLRLLVHAFWHVGCRTDFRREFWRGAWPLLKVGDIQSVIHLGVAGTHLIRFARDCAQGAAEASFYSDPNRSAFNASPKQP